MKPHESRVIIERSDLEIKIAALNEFLWSKHSDTLGRTDRNLLLKQLTIMNQYESVLKARIRAFYR